MLEKANTSEPSKKTSTRAHTISLEIPKKPVIKKMATILPLKCVAGVLSSSESTEGPGSSLYGEKEGDTPHNEVEHASGKCGLIYSQPLHEKRIGEPGAQDAPRVFIP